MEHAPLRPVPSRRSGPADPATAIREVTAALPALAPAEARALALVALAEQPRAEVAATLGIDELELKGVLARARKELRRTVAVLGGSGWCERAEELISDRLDGALAATDAGRLDVHLRNCPRCVEHERRLVQATDWLVAGVPGGAPVPLAPVPVEPAAPLAEAAPTGVDAATPTSTEVAAAAEVLVAVRTRRQIAAAVAWNSLIALAILLALATIGLTIAGILGAEL
jgi:Putative zinc-finger